MVWARGGGLSPRWKWKLGLGLSKRESLEVLLEWGWNLSWGEGMRKANVIPVFCHHAYLLEGQEGGPGELQISQPQLNPWENYLAVSP